MGHFGHDSQKPERGWTNNRHFQRLNLGPWKRGNAPKPKAVTVKKTISKTTGNCASYPRVNILPPDGFTLRTYPQGFADYVRDLLPDLVGGSERVEVDETQCPYQLFENLPFSTWEEAKLVPALKYARGNKHLNIPPEWLQVFPSPFEILHKLEEQRLDQRGQD